MPSHLTELLTAAVSEINNLHGRIDGLQQQLDKLKTDYAEFSQLRSGSLSPPGDISARSSSAPSSSARMAAHTSPVETLPGKVEGSLPALDRQPSASISLNESSAFQSSADSERDDAETFSASEGLRRPFVKWLPTTDDELPMIDARCRLKAAACRWALERRQLIADNVDFRAAVEPRDRDLIWQAKQLPDCFLWMSHSSAPIPTNPDDWQMVAGCFEVLALGVSLVQRMLEDPQVSPDLFQQGVDLLAEIQSALRIAVAAVSGPPTDHDQARIFGWLKSTAAERQMFIRRFMRLDDPADPRQWPELEQRVEALEIAWGEQRGRKNSRKKLLSRIRYKLSQLSQQDAPEARHVWESVAEDVDLLVSEGTPPSNVELRDLLVDYVDLLPELAGLPKGFQLTVREIDRYLSTSGPTQDSAVDPKAGSVTEEVVAATRLLSGKAAIIIGGDRRNHAAEALEKTFQLSELIWIDTRAHESVASFEPYVARPEVAMVLLAIRWSSHSYGEVQDFCRTYGKPLVRLPGGYNPNQVAAQIHEQCSERLVSSET